MPEKTSAGVNGNEREGRHYSGLFNPELKKNVTSKEYQELLLEQYKYYLDTAEATSSRRLQTNTFFITLNSGVLAAVGYVLADGTALSTKLMAAGAALAGLGLCIVWLYLLESYRALNTAKFEVIGLLEQQLAASPFCNAEWTQLMEANPQKPKYRPLSELEALTPKLMFAMYCFSLLVALLAAWLPQITAAAPQAINVAPLTIEMNEPTSSRPDGGTADDVETVRGAGGDPEPGAAQSGTNSLPAEK